MKHLKYFKESNSDYSIYNIDWHFIVPHKLTMIYDNKSYNFVNNPDTNIMKNIPLVQITYQIEGVNWGLSDCLEFDLHFLNLQNGRLKVDVDITWGNFMESEFSIVAPNKVDVIQCTSKDSRFDPSNTVFAFDDSSLQSIVEMFNKIDSFSITTKDLNFLHLCGKCPNKKTL